MWNVCVVDSCTVGRERLWEKKHADFCWLPGNEAEGTLVVFQTVNVSIRMLLERHWKSSLELCSHLHNNHHQYGDTYDPLQRYLYFFKKDFFWGGASVWSKWPRRGAMLSYDGNRLLHWWKIYPTPKRKFEVFHSK